jgi:hypothetical protein
MTERSIFWATTGTGDGGAGGYAANDLFEMFRSFFTSPAGVNYGGVAPDYLNKLAVTGSSSPAQVATGAALVYGIPYFNNGTVSITIATPTTGTRIDRLVLRASWALQTVRVTRIAGTEGAGTPPALTQSAGTTWDVPLAQVSITTGGVITIIDERQYVGGVGDLGIATAKIANLAVTTAKLADDAVTNAKLANMAANAVKGRITASTGDPEDLTPAQLLTIIKTVDGAASGLDADLLDGSHAAAFAAATHSHDTADIVDNAVTFAKLADMDTMTVIGRLAAGTGNPGAVSAVGLINLLETADGAGSGLDADTLDGEHAAAFAVAAHTHGASTITDDAVTNAKLANVNQYTVKGRIAAGAGDPTDLSAANLVTLIGTADGTGTGLDADLLDGQHAAAFAAAVHTHSTSGIVDDAITTAKIANDQVTNAKLANVAQNTIKGRIAAGAGDPADLSAAQVIDILETADGHDSGLDADTVDGAHATAFSLAIHTHDAADLLGVLVVFSAWVAIDAGSIYSQFGAGSPAPAVRKNGQLLQFAGVMLANSGIVTDNTMWPAFSLPAGYAPSQTRYVVAASQVANAERALIVKIDTAGVVSIYDPPVGVAIYLDLTVAL